MDVKTVCLGVLSMGDATGYEIRKQFDEGPFSHFFDAGYGSIYPALGKLLEGGLVSCESVAQEKRPDKKVYSITDAGYIKLCTSLTEIPAPDKIRSESMLVFFFEHLVSASQKRIVFDGYLAGLRGAVERVKAVDVVTAHPGRQFVNGFGLALYEAVIKYMEEQETLLFPANDADRTEKRAVGEN